MYKKLIYLVSLVLLLSVAGNALGDLVLHWPLDGDATDLSGNGYDGTVGGTANYVAGQIGQALDFDGSSTYIDLDDQIVEGTWSLAMWLRPRDIPYTTDYYAVMHTDAWAAGTPHVHLRNTSSLWNIDINSGPNISSTTVLQENEWYHCAYTILYEDGGNSAKLYINGVLESEGEGGTGPSAFGPLNFGAWNTNSRFYHGLMDDIRIYDHVLSEIEVMSAMTGEIWPYAWDPTPEDGGMHMDTWANLSWKPGGFAVSHDVYMGDNFEDVDAGAESTFQGNQGDTFFIAGFPGFAFPDGLVPGTTYYWRVDEVNDTEPNSPWKGEVWSFMIPPKTAYAPSPANGAKFIDPDADLNWTGGFGSKLHTVYFGDNFDEVNNAAGGLPQGNSTYDPGTLELEKTYYWRVDEFDAIETHKGNVWSFTITKPGGGLKAEYFNNTALSGDPVLTRVDPEIDFNWGNADVPGENSPDESINVNNFGARWTGELEVDLTDAYTFNINANNGFRLWLDGRLIINFWDNGTTSSRNSDSIELVGGLSYSIRMEYFEGEDTAIAQLFWQSSTREEQIIPSGALQPPLKAGSPSPFNGALDVSQTATLSWSPGETAASHDVYFGTDADAVKNADTSSPEYKGSRQLGSESYDPGQLEWNTTYYWRVDEVEDGGTIQKGNLWSFTTADFLIIDDMEGYNDIDEGMEGSNRIYNAWVDGYNDPTNGSQSGHLDVPFYEDTIVHSGNKSLPLYYDNAVGKSEATLTLDYPRDWTENGVDTLAIWYIGASANAAETMYVVLNGTAGVDNPDANAAQATDWTEWRISLQDFGINLTNVNTITLGFGNRTTPTAGGLGTVYFDDIRLYKPAP